MLPEADRPSGLRLFAGTTALAIVIHLLHEAAHMLAAMAYGVSGVMSSKHGPLYL
ncbi:hypothetical protein [Erythrobacter crassostreae]|uniref:Uncharacterized protein n=1 Tax=Erythrobacter crassostreae TaxID=2828328 RepID=A0A9X1JLS5_9SPHN|nr:hypothetical protein [Erythrobacter crassostrea]MBV7258068.1 hypothetical protein [Erythrobacter crassostrea]